MVMAGGGFRFSYYLGMYAAAVDTGNAPDLLLASCGGSIAAAVIRALPDDAQRKAWVASPAMYAFLSGLQSTRRAAIGRAFLHAVGRRLHGGRAPRIPDLFEDYFFDIPAVLPLPPGRAAGTPALAIVGGKLLFGPQDVGQLRAGRKLFAETVFGDARTAALLDGMAAPMSAPQWGENAIAPGLIADTAMPVGDAVRISISDMYYFRCHAGPSDNYMGGVIDLFPIEIAHRLARRVVVEMKAPFDQVTAIPALRAVLGIDGNARVRHLHGQRADVWIDSSDVEQALRAQGVQKKLDWRKNRIRLVVAPDYAAYVAHIEAQWQFGYQRAREAFARNAAGAAYPMRHTSRHNRSNRCP